MTIYIAGKITDDPDYKQKFKQAEDKLTADGHIVLNPAWLPSRGFTEGQYLNICFAMMRECEAVYMLKDWRSSKGATAEHSAAKIRGMMIFYGEAKNEEV